MICRSCTATFIQSDRNKHLPETSKYLISSLCLDCISAKLKAEENELYPTLVKRLKRHEKIKAAYHRSTKTLTEINQKFSSVNYERNIIIHNIHKEKKLIEEQKAKKQASTANKKTPAITPEMVEKMLANLTEEQRVSVMKGFTVS
jgi:hypothetical protein